ncbi:TetR/AcrR family transcriptional regulator [Nonomuraea gerenzanensis]|uniref:Transcriptional regulator, TetR family n=1 Tax=Nonomuraea gerenzanensis TaxID=93944 RepID=A0A1M4E1T6_9ACTN|nr:TetR/AcrR family transcriptional regulator [Nonomuraea gerenzanensis]UBU15035.1 TetR/AcrR family transcriptional regulator [Nonomuraea gerenzanensis]SBO92778.1 Transcriptional regulator, TetR family [Nonomuraea gerenzanensis]
MPTPRQRYREQVRREIKQAALAQISEGETVSLTAVARRLGMTGPALYKYFAGRDRLLAELIDDGLGELAAAVHVPASGGPREQLHVLARAFYDWAVANPGLFQLVASDPHPAGVEEVLRPFLPVFAQGQPAPVPATVLLWSRLLGVLSVELRGPFSGLGGALLAAEIDSLADLTRL